MLVHITLLRYQIEHKTNEGKKTSFFLSLFFLYSLFFISGKNANTTVQCLSMRFCMAFFSLSISLVLLFGSGLFANWFCAKACTRNSIYIDDNFFLFCFIPFSCLLSVFIHNSFEFSNVYPNRFNLKCVHLAKHAQSTYNI